MRKLRNNLMHRSSEQPLSGCRKCGARTRRGTTCRSPAMKNGRCRMHGGASTGAPKGNQNAWKHGKYSAHADMLSALEKSARGLLSHY
ncbi:HGGxSTG domain-containing protein [Hyphomonas chukchiensis]|uniref:HGGxSTG domain-containing protein n=1 Tax=Hyphomonas chukchiensis TaxID=1280947 RepID=UPI003C6D1766